MTSNNGRCSYDCRVFPTEFTPNPDITGIGVSLVFHGILLVYGISNLILGHYRIRRSGCTGALYGRRVLYILLPP